MTERERLWYTLRGVRADLAEAEAKGWKSSAIGNLRRLESWLSLVLEKKGTA